MEEMNFELIVFVSDFKTPTGINDDKSMRIRVE